MHTTSPPRPVAPRRSGSSTSASRPTRALPAPRPATRLWRRPACRATELRSASAGSTTLSASSSPPEVTAIRRAAFIAAAVGLLFLVGCARSPAAEDVAVEYGRAIYRYDAAAIYRLASAADRRAKDEETVRAQVGGPTGFALDIIRHLALFIEAKPVDTRPSGNRATVSLKLTQPDANAPQLRTPAHNGDEPALDAPADGERAQSRRKL